MVALVFMSSLHAPDGKKGAEIAALPSLRRYEPGQVQRGSREFASTARPTGHPRGEAQAMPARRRLQAPRAVSSTFGRGDAAAREGERIAGARPMSLNTYGHVFSRHDPGARATGRPFGLHRGRLPAGRWPLTAEANPGLAPIGAGPASRKMTRSQRNEARRGADSVGAWSRIAPRATPIQLMIENQGPPVERITARSPETFRPGHADIT